jgi:hypothetical protein
MGCLLIRGGSPNLSRGKNRISRFKSAIKIKTEPKFYTETIIMRKLLSLSVFCLLFASQTGIVSAAEPGWSSVIIATGSYGEKIRSTPMEKRPYRPFHVYGNTVRRMHHRGTPIPLPRILVPSQLVPRLGILR